MICSRSVWRNNSPDPGIIGFGPIKTPEKFAGKRAHIISNPANSNHQNYPETRAAIGFADFSGPTPYDIEKDLTRINGLLAYPAVFSVHPSVPVENVQQFIDYAKSNPGKLNYGTVGTGNHISLAPAMFQQKTNIEINDIPYKGSGQAVIDLLGGNIQFMFDTVSVPLQHINAGKLRALATTGETRSPVLPDVPTLMEEGVDMSMFATLGIMGPANMPKDIVDRLNSELSKVMETPEVRDSFSHLGMEVKTFDTAQAYEDFFRKDIDSIGRLISSSKID